MLCNINQRKEKKGGGMGREENISKKLTTMSLMALLQGSANFCKRPDGQYLRGIESLGLCGNHSTLSPELESSHTTCTQMRLTSCSHQTDIRPLSVLASDNYFSHQVMTLLALGMTGFSTVSWTFWLSHLETLGLI